MCAILTHTPLFSDFFSCVLPQLVPRFFPRSLLYFFSIFLLSFLNRLLAVLHARFLILPSFPLSSSLSSWLSWWWLLWLFDNTIWYSYFLRYNQICVCDVTRAWTRFPFLFQMSKDIKNRIAQMIHANFLIQSEILLRDPIAVTTLFLWKW